MGSHCPRTLLCCVVNLGHRIAHIQPIVVSFIQISLRDWILIALDEAVEPVSPLLASTGEAGQASDFLSVSCIGLLGI